MVAGLSVLAAVLGSLFLGRHSLWLDEAVSFNIARVPSEGLAAALSREANMPLYYLILRGWIALGSSEATLRSLSVVFAVATIPVVYVLVARLFDTATATVAGLLLAVNAFFVHYAQEARGYSLLLLLAVLATYLFVRGVQQPSWQVWAAYAVAIALAFHTHNFGLWMPVVHGASLVLLPGGQAPWRAFLAACGGGAVLSLPFARVVAEGAGQDKLAWVPRPRVSDVADVYWQLAGGDLDMAKLAYLAAGLLGLLAVGRALRSAGRSEAWRHGLLLSWLVVPVVGSFLFSVAVTPVFVPRYLIVSLPALVIVAALGLTQLPSRLLVTASAIMVATSLMAVAQWYRSDGYQDWRGATAYVASRLGGNDVVVVAPSYMRYPLGYYSERLDLPSELILFSDADVATVRGRDGVWVMRAGTRRTRLRCAVEHDYVEVGGRRFTGVEIEEFRPRQGSVPGLFSALACPVAG